MQKRYAALAATAMLALATVPTAAQTPGSFGQTTVGGVTVPCLRNKLGVCVPIPAVGIINQAPIATSGKASDLIGPDPVPPSLVPAPTGTTRGGVLSGTAPTGQVQRGVDANGAPIFGLPGINGATPGPFATGTDASKLTGTAPSGVLPLATPAAPGAVKSGTAPSNQFQTGVDTAANPSFRQPSAADVSGLAPSATTDTTKADNITSGTLPAGRLPSPSATTLGGVFSGAAPTHQFETGVDTAGRRIFAQPNASDVSGLAASATTDATNAANIVSGTLPAARLPSPSTAALGGVLSGSAPSHQFGTGIDANGRPTFGQPGASDVSGLSAFATSTDLVNASGTLAFGRLPASVPVATLSKLAALPAAGPGAGLFAEYVVPANLTDPPGPAGACSKIAMAGTSASYVIEVPNVGGGC